MTDRQNFQHPIQWLKSIAESGLNDLAETCGKTLERVSSPAAVEIKLENPGVDPQAFSDGNSRYLKYLSGFTAKYDSNIDEYGFPNARIITISTDVEEIICIGSIRYLGNIVGFASAVSPLPEKGPLPLQQGLGLVILHVESRINTLLAPGSLTSLEIFGKKLIDDLSEIGVCAACVKPPAPGHILFSVALVDKQFDICEIDESPVENNAIIKSGALIEKVAITALWPGIAGIDAGIWLTDSQGRLIALGFSDKKLVNKAAKEKINKYIKTVSEADIEYIIASFEKLKNEYKNMVNSERAAAVTETAVTVNHEINNPLTAILGNTQLLLMNKEKLSAETIAKLETIEKSAIQIRETTNKLMKIIDPVRKHYASGLEMIDIEKSRKKQDKDK